MTERGRRWIERSADRFVVGPSRLHWDGSSLVIDLDEVGAPLPRRVRGRVRVWPQATTDYVTALDAAGRHRWGPIAPCARVEVDLQAPAVRWSGHAYVDSNEGDEPLERAFDTWDWSRSALPDGSTAVIYDMRRRDGSEHLIAQRFRPDGTHEAFEAPPRQPLASTGWRVARAMRSERESPARVRQTLEDTPFYTRSLLDAGLFGHTVPAVHESLSVPRLESLPVRLMLPWRMPRRR